MNVALRTKYINLISLCTGGGGLDLGIELAMPSARSVVLVEREAFAVCQLVSAIQQGLMAEAAIWSDVATFNGRPWRGVVDGVIGGIPCQPHSLAGKREGSDDDRDLWSDARRIIVQSGAWFVLIENVSGMLSAKPSLDPGALRVWRDLSRLGFDVEGGLFTAAEVGASHERERVFILGVTGLGLADAYGKRLEGIGPDVGAQRRSDARGSTGLCDGATLEHTARDRRREGRPKPGRQDVQIRPSIGRGFAEGAGADLGLFPPGPSNLRSWESILKRAPELEPAFRRVADGLASGLDTARVDRLRMLGNGVVPLQAAYAVRTLATRLAEGGSAGAARLVRMMEPL